MLRRPGTVCMRPMLLPAPSPRLEALLDEAAQDVLGQEAEQDEHDQDDGEEGERDEDAAAPSHQAFPGCALNECRPCFRRFASSSGRRLDCPSKMLTFIDSYNFED